MTEKKTMTETAKTIQRTNISFDEDVHKALRLYALETGVSLAVLVNRLCLEGLARRGISLQRDAE